MNVIWVYRRLRSMSIGEILWRVKCLGWQIWARINYKRWDRKYKRQQADSTRILEMLAKVNFYGLSDVKPDDVPNEWKQRTKDAADKLLKHNYQLFAVEHIDLGDEIDFNLELKNNIKTPLEFAPWMDYRNVSLYGDYKYYWELSRLQHLVTLAKSYHLTGDIKYASEVESQLLVFDKQNPYLQGVNWIMPMETAIRLVSLVWIVAFLRDYLENKQDVCGLLERLILSHVDYTAANYAAYSSANNHLIGEAAGVFIAALCFSDLKGMESHRKKAYDILCREIDLQHHKDGVNKEQAVHYQEFSINFFLYSGLLGRGNGIEFPESYWDILEKSIDFVCSISDGDCHVPHIGDGDDGKVLVLDASDHNETASLFSLASVLYGRGDFKAMGAGFDETSLWLLGSGAEKKFNEITSPSEGPGSKSFPEGGYYILKDDKSKTRLIFDCGPLGFGSISAHGHADALSFILSFKHKDILIDPGTYIYMVSEEYRNYFRSTAAHNVLEIDGCDQSEMSGAFLWKHKAKACLTDWSEGDDKVKVSGWHDGYEVLNDPVVHRRSIEMDKKQKKVIVKDHVESGGSHTAVMRFHLSEACSLEQIENNVWRITNEDVVVTLTVDSKLRSKVLRGSTGPLCGWASKGYDLKHEINTIVCEGTFESNDLFTTEIDYS